MRASRFNRVPRVEHLEPRQVLAASPASVALGEDGVLTIVGTKKDDRVAVSLVEDVLVVAVNGMKHEFSPCDVSSLSIDLGNGDDRLEIADDVAIDAWINGGKGNDKLRGGGGNDWISGGHGHDRLDGGLGNDHLAGEHGDDKLSGGEGDDSLSGGQGHDWLSGDAGNDDLHGDQGHDKLSGGDGEDTLYGAQGHDKLSGDAGDDVLYGEQGHDVLRGGDGNDFAYGDAGHDELFGDAGDDWLDGGDGHDKAKGGLGNDKLKGGKGNDVLDGNEGDNLLDGDEGKNKLKNGTEVDLDVPQDNFQPLIANLSSSGTASGAAYYERETTVNEEGSGGLETFLHIVVNGAAPDSLLDVLIGGALFAQLQTDSTGFGELRFSTIADQPGEQPFPDGFTLSAGALISVGDELTGQFELA